MELNTDKKRIWGLKKACVMQCDMIAEAGRESQKTNATAAGLWIVLFFV